MFNDSYIQRCLNGEATLFELDDYIDFWHDNETGVSLREFLGLTEYEYKIWGNSSDAIFRDILRCRREGIEFSEYQKMGEKDKIAARSFDEEAIEKLRKKND
mgnify:CR=1 FL=1